MEIFAPYMQLFAPYKHLLYIVGTVIALFTTTFLRGFQSRNVAGGHKRLAFVFGTAMNLCDLSIIVMVAANPSVYVLLFGSLSSGCGWVAGMIAHERLMRARTERERLEKKQKRKKQIRSLAKDEIDTRLKEHGLL